MVGPPGAKADAEPSLSACLTVAGVLSAAFPSAADGSSRQIELPVSVIPQAGEPRWIVVGDPRIAAQVLKSWRPFKVSTRLRWSAVVASASLGVLHQLPGVVTSRHAIDVSYWRQSLAGFEDDWAPVLYIGNPSHTRKVTVFFVGRDRRFKAVAKIPLLEDSARAILNEAQILRELAGAGYLPGFLFNDPERGIAAQSWLEGEPVSRQLTSAHMDLLARFAVPGETIRVSGQRASIAGELDGADLPFDRAALARAQQLLEYDQPLPAFIEHRDFAPWNLKSLPGGGSGAIDWEWAILRGLPCQDIFRYFYIQDALFNGPGHVWRELNRHPLVQAHFRRFAIPAEALRPLAMHYQLRVLAMDWKSGNTRLAQYAFRQIETLLHS
jgi:Phosphotransferase enzyme family